MWVCQRRPSPLAAKAVLRVPEIVTAAPKSQVLHRGFAAQRPGFHVIELEASTRPTPAAIIGNERAPAFVPQVDLAGHRRGDMTAAVRRSSSSLRAVAAPLASDSESLLRELALVRF